MPKRICNIDECDRPLTPPHGRGMCGRHYQRWARYGDPLHPPQRRVARTCSIDGCDKPCVGQGWCSKHWTRWDRHGSPTARLRGEVLNGCRVCPTCQQDKPLDEWGKSECLPCVAMRASRYRQTHPETVNTQNARRRARLSVTIEQFTRREIFERDNWTCQICHHAIDENTAWPHPASASLDHVVPLALGGGHTRANTQTACLRCNIRKGARLM